MDLRNSDSFFSPKPFTARIRRERAAFSRSPTDSIPSFSQSRWTVFGPTPSSFRSSGRESGIFALSSESSGKVPVCTMDIIFFAMPLPIPGIAIRAFSSSSETGTGLPSTCWAARS